MEGMALDSSFQKLTEEGETFEIKKIKINK